MSAQNHDGRQEGDGGAKFPATQWSLVLQAAASGVQGGDRALEELCRRYWLPIYAYARKSGRKPVDAQDLAQGFFGTLIEKGYLKSADRERGKFRTFLLTSFKAYHANQLDRDKAWKRGGRAEHFSLDVEEAEENFRLESASSWSPEKVFDRKWVLTIMDRALDKLQDEYRRLNKLDRFESLKAFIIDDPSPFDYQRVAGELALSQSGLRSAVMRLRRRYNQLFQDEIAETVSDPASLQEEIQHLLASLSS